MPGTDVRVFVFFPFFFSFFKKIFWALHVFSACRGRRTTLFTLLIGGTCLVLSHAVQCIFTFCGLGFEKRREKLKLFGFWVRGLFFFMLRGFCVSACGLGEKGERPHPAVGGRLIDAKTLFPEAWVVHPPTHPSRVCGLVVCVVPLLYFHACLGHVLGGWRGHNRLAARFRAESLDVVLIRRP